MANHEPCEYKIGGEPVQCDHCKHTKFVKGSAMLNTAGMTFIGLDWANRTATTLMCDRCGLIHWFGRPPVPESAGT